MKTIEEFLSYLRHLDVKLWADGDRLRYNAPDKTLTPALRAELAERKAEILTFLHKANRVSISTIPSIQPIPRDTDLPLSFAQQRLWFLEQLEDSNAIYNMPAALHLIGSLHIAALEQSLNEVLRRHEALRTNFATMDERPAQVIAPALTVTLSVIDLQALPEVEQFPEARRLATEEAQRPFELANSSLLRITLLRLGEEEHVLLVIMHHIVSDGWSIGIFIRELATLYEAFLSDQPSPLPALPIQYADFAHWQRQWLQGEVLETQLNYWQQQLAGVPPLLEFPTDRPRPPVQTFRGSTEHFQINPDLTRRLKDLSQQSGTTLFMTLLAAYVTLLSRYSGQEDIVVGSPIANRTRTEIESIIGFFVNTLVLRTHLQGNPTFQELLSRVRQVALDAYAHQDVPFELLVEALQPERNLSYTPLFQVVFVLQNAPTGRLELPGLSITPLEIPSVTAKFDLTLSMTETEQGLTGELEYNTDLFDAARITRIAGHFQTLLEAVVANPQQLVSELFLLTEAERHQLLVEWNDTFADYPQNKCIHHLFEAQVERTPDGVAVVFEDKQLTYCELNRRANQLAHYLQALGIEPEVLVGLCVERSLEMVVGLLGILKAGAAYVPLDPAYPKERLTFMLEDSQVPVLLTEEKLVAGLLEQKARVVCLDRDWGVIAQKSEENPVSGVKCQNLAYVIYTSGSTGKPKGVLVAHQGLCNLASAQIRCFDVELSSRVLQFASFSFDASIWEVVMALCSGAMLCLGTKDSLLPGTALMQLLYEQAITHVTLPPSALAALPTEELPALRTIIVAGEACSTDLVAQWSTGRRFFNAYGPTESTVCATVAECTDSSRKPSIGRPIANTQIYILDRNLQPVPIGVPGELHIGGVGLACGYLNRPKLTEEKFIPNPFSDEPGARLYKTGDKACYLPDGNIEFIDRLDHQVKIRGFRIELREIEAALALHLNVLQTVVIAQEDKAGNKRLVTYVVPNQGQVPTSSELRRFLKQKLPDYMVPATFVMLEALPLTPNGKVDRRLLPAPDSSQRSLEKNFVAPRTPTEEVIAAIWVDILGLKQVGIHDNFFELGGHSLLATQVISHLRKAFQVELTLRTLFERSTTAELAELVIAKQFEQAESEALKLILTEVDELSDDELKRLDNLSLEKRELVLKKLRTQKLISATNNECQALPIVPVSRDQTIPLSFSQQRLWFLDQFDPGSPAYNIPCAVHLSGAVNVVTLEQSLNEVVRRHEVLRSTFATVDGRPVQVIAPVSAGTLSVVDIREIPEPEREILVQGLISEEVQHSFDLSRDPLMRATLLRLGEEDHVLILNIHHIASDGWSMGILIREVGTLYRAFSTGKTSPLPELPIQYADFAFWQQQWLQSEALESQLSYWKQQLAGKLPVLELPTDRSRRPIRTSVGAIERFTVDKELTNKLRMLGLQEGASLYMIMLAALQTLLYRYTGQEDISVGTYIANRNRAEVESLIGFFVNTLVMRTDLSGAPTFRELLGRVREVTLGAYAHQDVPIEKLLEQLQPERNLSYTPLFQVMLVLQNTPMHTLDLPGLTIQPLKVEGNTHAHFDLTLWLEEMHEGLVGSMEYNTDLFDSSTIIQMLVHFQTLLESVVANPSQRLSDLPLLTNVERNQLLFEWNDTKTDYLPEQCIHELFEAQAERTPDAVAVVFGDQQLTYRELNCRANQLAYHLQGLGIGPEVLVGICVERSLEMVVGLLGILKAGGAYVPLDPAYPKERLAFMLSDAQVSVLLTQKKLGAGLPEHRAYIVYLDTDWGVISQESEKNPVKGVIGKNLAYVIYTSGSTSKPKGVTINHRSLVNAYQAWEHAYQLRGLGTSHLQMASFSFDVFSGDLIRALCSGAKLVLCPREWLLAPEKLYKLMRKEKVDCAEFVPAVLRNLVQYLDRTEQDLNFMRLLVVGSDSWYVKEYEEFQRFCGPDTRFINSYGVSEATIDSTYFESTKVNLPVDELLPIGRPFANTQIYILDRHLQPVPIGVPGELHIGGASLARGYLNRPKLTEEKFIPNPFSHEPGARLYKTGDKACYLPDGNIQFLGRLDNQVKIRGFRIELGEIEAVLAQHPVVRETVVIAQEDAPSDKRLVAYVVANEGHEPTVSELRRFLKEKLPEYMVPSAFVMLEAVPLTPNGKVDRCGLPAPDTSRRGLEEGFVAPRDTIELQLAQIWEDVLNVHPVGVRDNFFDLGGHSLLAVNLVAKIQQQFAKNLPLAILFQGSTIEHLAGILSQQTDSLSWSPLVTIQSGGSKRPFFCVPGGGGNVIYFYHLARYLGLDQPFYGLQAMGLDGESQPNTRVEDIAACYIKALLGVQPQGPYFLGGHSGGGWVAFEMAQQLQKQGHRVDLLAILDVQAPVPGNNPVDVDGDEATWLVIIARQIERWLGKKLEVTYEALQPLPPDEQLNYFKERLKIVNLLPHEASTTQARGFLQVFKANAQALAHYNLQEVYPTRITLLRASEFHPEDTTLPTENLLEDPTWGWGQLSAEPVEIHVVPGDHLTMMAEPHVQVLAERLRACLDKAQADD